MKPKTKYGYKVVCKLNGKKKSAWVSAPCKLEYSHTRWTFPRRLWGPLCVFSNLKKAKSWRKFVRYWRNVGHIYRCVYEPSNMKFIWGRISLHTTSSGKHLPNGTKLAKRVKLIGKEIR